VSYSITVAGIGLRFVTFQEQKPAFRGDAVEAFDNTLQDGRDAKKRRWAGTTDWHTTAEEASLRTAVEGTGPVTCSGLVLPGGSVSAVVDVETVDYGPAVQAGITNYAAVNVRLSLTLREA
jgi:hypothetical protein